MIHGHLRSSDTYAPLLLDPVWREAFTWLQQMPGNVAKGMHQLRGTDLYANVMEYETLPREQCIFETHRKFVDLQYTIAGGEVIGWRLAAGLEAAGSYDAGRDVQFYRQAAASASVGMPPGYFSIFYPSDAHLPRVADGVQASVYKVVIKVGLGLLARA